MGCHDILKQICDELSEDIHSELCEKLKKHLDTCEKCKSQLEALRHAVDMYRCLEDKNVPADVHRRLLQLLNVGDKS